MERESFEDPETAALLNARFVAIKVDREERPDVDGIYMDAVQAMTGAGGWPMSVFLTPDGKPFYAGTYFPDEPRHGMPGVPPGPGGDRRRLGDPPRRGRASRARAITEAIARAGSSEPPTGRLGDGDRGRARSSGSAGRSTPGGAASAGRRSSPSR